MPTNTNRLGLFKYQIPDDENSTFNITESMNNNWDKLEQNIAITKHDFGATYSRGDWVIEPESSKFGIFLSKQDGNVGHKLTEIDWWEFVNFYDLDKLNQSKAMETGNVSNDADVYPYILEYAHSTFDKSKFTISGSPTISYNGIASGFSASNYIRVTLNIPKITSSFLIKGKATIGTLGSKPQQLFLLNNNCRAELSLDGSELIFFSGDFTSNVNLAIRFKTPLKQSDVLEYTFSLDNSTGKIKADALINNTDNYDTSKDFTLNP